MKRFFWRPYEQFLQYPALCMARRTNKTGGGNSSNSGSNSSSSNATSNSTDTTKSQDDSETKEKSPNQTSQGKNVEVPGVTDDYSVKFMQYASGQNKAGWQEGLDNAGEVDDEGNNLFDLFVPNQAVPYYINDKSKTGNVVKAYGETKDFPVLEFDLPKWGIEDYINERSRWVKGVNTLTSMPGFFYFKVFFKFDTSLGLFGGVMKNNQNIQIYPGTCAKRFLHEIVYGYRAERVHDRMLALHKFTYMLSQINSQYPWLIKKVNNLGSTFKRLTEQEDTEAERKIELVFSNEHTDMKLLNMLHLYRYICYDDINMKEVLPSNLRKFDMKIVLYHMPIRYVQTGIMTAKKLDFKTQYDKWKFGNPNTLEKVDKAVDVIGKTFNYLASKSLYFKYKRMHPENNDFSNMMSFHMITLHNCEFDVSTFNAYFDSAEITNEEPFSFNDITIGINYGRAYHHTMNEWNQYLFGSDGFYYNGLPSKDDGKSTHKNLHFKRLDALIDAYHTSGFNDQLAGQWHSLIDYSEKMITDALMTVNMEEYYAFEKGNIYGDVGPGSAYHEYKEQYDKNLSFGNLYGGVPPSQNPNPEAYFRLKYGELVGKKDLGAIYGGDNYPEEYNRDKWYYDSRNVKFGTDYGLKIPRPSELRPEDFFEEPRFIFPMEPLEWLKVKRTKTPDGWEEIKRMAKQFYKFPKINKNDVIKF